MSNGKDTLRITLKHKIAHTKNTLKHRYHKALKDLSDTKEQSGNTTTTLLTENSIVK